RGDDPQRRVALLLDEGPQRGGVRQCPVEAVEGVQEPGPSLARESLAAPREDGLRRADDHLAEQLLPAAAPAAARRAAQPELRRDRQHGPPAPAEVAVEAGLDDVLPAGGRPPAAARLLANLRHA